jgi:ABC-type sugar transport system ATPase subunit
VENGGGQIHAHQIGFRSLSAGWRQIVWQGREVAIRFHLTTPCAAGIATIHQELAYFSHLSRRGEHADGRIVGPRRSLWERWNWREFHRQARDQLARFDLEIPTDRSFHEIEFGLRNKTSEVSGVVGLGWRIGFPTTA